MAETLNCKWYLNDTFLTAVKKNKVYNNAEYCYLIIEEKHNFETRNNLLATKTSKTH